MGENFENKKFSNIELHRKLMIHQYFSQYGKVEKIYMLLETLLNYPYVFV